MLSLKQARATPWYVLPDTIMSLRVGHSLGLALLRFSLEGTAWGMFLCLDQYWQAHLVMSDWELYTRNSQRAYLLCSTSYDIWLSTCFMESLFIIEVSDVCTKLINYPLHSPFLYVIYQVPWQWTRMLLPKCADFFGWIVVEVIIVSATSCW